MSAPWFIWKNRLNLDEGVILHQYPTPTRPTERNTRVTIPGRSGDLTVLEDYGAPVYDAYNLSFDCYVREGYDRRRIMEWLRGSGELVLGNDPNMVYDARIDEQFVMKQLYRGRTFYDLQFIVHVQPYKRQRVGEKFEIIAKNGTVEVGLNSGSNPGSAPAYPRVTLKPGFDIKKCVLAFGDADARHCVRSNMATAVTPGHVYMATVGKKGWTGSDETVTDTDSLLIVEVDASGAYVAHHEVEHRGLMVFQAAEQTRGILWSLRDSAVDFTAVPAVALTADDQQNIDLWADNAVRDGRITAAEKAGRIEEWKGVCLALKSQYEMSKMISAEGLSMIDISASGGLNVYKSDAGNAVAGQLLDISTGALVPSVDKLGKPVGLVSGWIVMSYNSTSDVLVRAGVYCREVGVCFYDSSKKFIRGERLQGGKAWRVLMPSGCAYVRYSVDVNGRTGYTIGNLSSIGFAIARAQTNYNPANEYQPDEFRTVYPSTKTYAWVDQRTTRNLLLPFRRLMYYMQQPDADSHGRTYVADDAARTIGGSMLNADGGIGGDAYGSVTFNNLAAGESVTYDTETGLTYNGDGTALVVGYVTERGGSVLTSAMPQIPVGQFMATGYYLVTGGESYDLSDTNIMHIYLYNADYYHDNATAIAEAMYTVGETVNFDSKTAFVFYTTAQDATYKTNGRTGFKTYQGGCGCPDFTGGWMVAYPSARDTYTLTPSGQIQTGFVYPYINIAHISNRSVDGVESSSILMPDAEMAAAEGGVMVSSVGGYTSTGTIHAPAWASTRMPINVHGWVMRSVSPLEYLCLDFGVRSVYSSVQHPSRMYIMLSSTVPRTDYVLDIANLADERYGDGTYGGWRTVSGAAVLINGSNATEVDILAQEFRGDGMGQAIVLSVPLTNGTAYQLALHMPTILDNIPNAASLRDVYVAYSSSSFTAVALETPSNSGAVLMRRIWLASTAGLDDGGKIIVPENLASGEDMTDELRLTVEPRWKYL